MAPVSPSLTSALRRSLAAAALVTGTMLVASGHAEGVLNGQTIRLIAVSDPVFKVMQQIHDEMEKMAGGKIELTVLPFDTLHQQVLLNSQNAESRYDIVAVDLPQFGEYKSLLLDLTPQAGKMDHSDFQAAAWEGVIHDGKILAIPIQPHPEIFAYRTDLFQAAGIAAPPKTTDDVLADAKQLNHPEKNVAAICWNAARGTPLGQTFLQTLGAFHVFAVDRVQEPAQKREHFFFRRGISRAVAKALPESARWSLFAAAEE